MYRSTNQIARNSLLLNTQKLFSLQVELSMGTEEGGGPSDAAMCMATLKLEFASYVSAPSAAPKQRATVRCPICTEAHQIPEAGISGFRKDFR